MKIAVFYNLHFGGAKRAVFEQVKGLSKRGHVIDVYTTDPYDDIFSLKKISNNYYSYDFNSHKGKVPLISRFIKDLQVFITYKNLHKKIAEDIDKNNYDLVLCHPDVITQAPYLLRYLKTKSSYFCQEPLRIAYEYILRPDRSMGLLNYVYEKITRAIRKNIDLRNVRSASYTIASCFHVRERIIEVYGVWPKISYLGVDTYRFKPIKAKKKNQLIFFGNKDEINNGYDLAKDAVSLLPKNISLNLIIVPWIKENKKRLTDDELIKYYNESIATFALSRLETFGLTPIESMSCGVPVIATNVSGHRETVLDGKTGFLVDFDPNEIKDKILELINNKNLREQMGKNGRKHIEKEWTWDKRIIEFEKLLYSFIENEKK